MGSTTAIKSDHFLIQRIAARVNHEDPPNNLPEGYEEQDAGETEQSDGGFMRP